jgi:hypothetical protein
MDRRWKCAWVRLNSLGWCSTWPGLGYKRARLRLRRRRREWRATIWGCRRTELCRMPTTCEQLQGRPSFVRHHELIGLGFPPDYSGESSSLTIASAPKSSYSSHTQSAVQLSLVSVQLWMTTIHDAHVRLLHESCAPPHIGPWKPRSIVYELRLGIGYDSLPRVMQM